MSMKNDMMLYLNMNDRLLGLNLREFIKRHSSRPEVEVISDYPNHRRRRACTNFHNIEKYPMTVFNSKLYMMIKKDRVGESFDLNVYSFDPNDCKSIRLCDKSAAPRLMDGHHHPIVFTHDEKLYSLVDASYSSRRSGGDPHLFWVFDPFHECWKPLPRPPFDDYTLSVRYEVSYGHKILIDTHKQKYIFDAHQERWELWKSSERGQCYEKHHFSALVEFDDGFFIAVTNQTNNEFCKKRSSAFMSNFGVVHDLYPEGCPSTIPSRMRHICVGSKVYLVCGQRLDRRIHSDAHGRCFAMPNFDIYGFNYTEEGPSITLCQCEGSIPRLIDPRTKTIPIIITVDNKI